MAPHLHRGLGAAPSTGRDDAALPLDGAAAWSSLLRNAGCYQRLDTLVSTPGKWTLWWAGGDGEGEVDWIEIAASDIELELVVDRGEHAEVILARHQMSCQASPTNQCLCGYRCSLSTQRRSRHET
jgi:hypothetical protein